jgi:hypothetical protein
LIGESLETDGTAIGARATSAGDFTGSGSPQPDTLETAQIARIARK